VTRLDRVEIRGEHEARERAWQVVRAAYAERDPLPRPRRRLAPAIALAAVAAVAAVAFTPAGRAVVETVRDAIGVESAQEALFSLPAPGRLLVVADGGAWAVADDGSERRLGEYGDAGCSPFGRFVAAVGPHELVALEPDGDVRWKLSRPGARGPRWGGTFTDTRIAYLSRRTVRVVAGDGTGDHELAAGRAVAWRPGSVRLLAVAHADGISVFDVQSGRALWTRDIAADRLAWSADGTRILGLRAGHYAVLSAAGRLVTTGPALSAAFATQDHVLAIVRRSATGSELVVGGRLRFQGTGTFRDPTWAPDGRWLAIAWPEADQLVFVRATGPKKISAAANLSRQFDSTSTPRLAGWCPLP